jgi:hypothetical protein
MVALALQLCKLRPALGFNAQSIEAAAAMFVPDVSNVQVGQMHGGRQTPHGAEGIREPIAVGRNRTLVMQENI